MTTIVDLPRVHRPSPASFREQFVEPRRAAILTGVMDWPAMAHWTPEWLREHHGETEVTAVLAPIDPPAGRALTTEELRRVRTERLSLDRYLTQLEQPDASRHSISALPLRSHLPALLDDVEIPPFRDEEITTSPRLWLSSKMIGPLHYDSTNNLHGIVYGAKRFVLFDPRESRHLYPSSVFSRIPTMSRALLSEVESGQFPRVADAKRSVVDLERGEMLFLPAGWWHQVTTPNVTISVDFPWERSPQFTWPFLRLLPSKFLARARGTIGVK